MHEDEHADVDTVARKVDALNHRVLGGLGTIVSRVGKGNAHDLDRSDADVPLAPAASLTTPSPLRETRAGSRTQVTRELPSSFVGNAAKALDEDQTRGSLPEGRELHRQGSVDLVEPAPWSEDRVRPISRLGDAVPALVLDDFEPEPAYRPAIGPELTAARTRVGLSVDELAERTRIRPHVIESIEVDDFVPVRWGLLRPRSPAHARAGAGQGPGAAAGHLRRRYATAPDEPAAGLRGRARRPG